MESNGLDGWSLAAGEAASQATSQSAKFHSRIPPPPFNTAASESLGVEEELYVDENCTHMPSSEDGCLSPPGDRQPMAEVPRAKEKSCAFAELLNQDVIVEPVSNHFGASNSDLDFSCSGELDSSAVDAIDTELLLASLSSEEADSQKGEGASQRTENYGKNLICKKQNQQTCQYEAQKMYSNFAKFYSRNYLQKSPYYTSQEKTRSTKEHLVPKIGLEFTLECQVPLKPVNDFGMPSSKSPICRSYLPGKENIPSTSIQSGSSVSNIAPAQPQIKSSLFDENVPQQPELKCDKQEIRSQTTRHSPCLLKSEDDLRNSADLVAAHAIKDGWRCPRAGKKIARNTSKQRLLDSWLSRTAR